LGSGAGWVRGQRSAATGRGPIAERDHDTPQAGGVARPAATLRDQAGRTAILQNRRATERPGAASARPTRRPPRHADGQIKGPATPRAGRIPSCSSTPPAPHTPKVTRPPAKCRVNFLEGCHLSVAVTIFGRRSALYGKLCKRRIRTYGKAAPIRFCGQ
jgi:hypothetical protein